MRRVLPVVVVVLAALAVGGAAPAGAATGPRSAVTPSATQGVLMGRVTDSTGAPLGGICVAANHPGQPPISTASGADGRYALAVPGGTYTMQFFPGCGGGNYAIQWYPGTLSYNGATPVAVANGTTVPSIDAAMTTGATITGAVVDAHGHPVVGACVYAYLELPQGQNITYNDVLTGADGSYTLRGMTAGGYTIEFVPSCADGSTVAVEWYPGVASQDKATVVQVTAGATATGIGAQLDQGGSVSGRVVDAQGVPLSGICVNPVEHTSSGDTTFVEAITDAQGRYTANALPPGNVLLQFFSGCGGGDYISSWYPSATTVGQAVAIPLAAGQAAAVPDATMTMGGAVAGSVADTTGKALDGICVEATSTATSGPYAGYYGSTLTDGTGNYHLGGLPTAPYIVDFRSGCSGGAFTQSWYPGASSRSGAVPVAVTAGTTISGIDARLTPSADQAPASPLPAAPSGVLGYWEAGSDGSVYAWGDAVFHGAAAGRPLSAPVVSMAAAPDGGGYWLAGSDGSVSAFGDAVLRGSASSLALKAPIVGMAATPDGGGYWLVASDGGIFSFGDARFFGSTGAIRLNQPIVGMASTPDGAGYWLVASDGGVFCFGDAAFRGSTGALKLVAPIVGMAATPSGAGYWLAAADGGVFTFGDAPFKGSAGGREKAAPIAGIGRTPTGAGYWLVATNGGIFGFGDGGFDGSADAYGPGTRVVALAPTPA